eukprot:TRINITY_DN22491_c0_g1_i1.p1 TRINITY_DN22491_c0_g1~~TRINITY_DN22491_c0_g1_i1.p1  ORF type:complete len:366 (-),score=37.40 TRINITY_DN22491_c0_g1_i1:86-1183(-)
MFKKLDLNSDDNVSDSILSDDSDSDKSEEPEEPVEIVLIDLERRMLDWIDVGARKVFCFPGSESDDDSDSCSTASSRQADKLARYVAWQKAREKNVLLGLISKISGIGCAEPTLCERVLLLCVFTAISYAVFAYNLKADGSGCRKSWVDLCVPVDYGGHCSGGLSSGATADECGAHGESDIPCATNSTLEALPLYFLSYEEISVATAYSPDSAERFRKEGEHAKFAPAQSVCEVPLCKFCPCAHEHFVFLKKVVALWGLKTCIYFPVRMLSMLSVHSLWKQSLLNGVMVIICLPLVAFGAKIHVHHLSWCWGALAQDISGWLCLFVVTLFFSVIATFFLGYVVRHYILERFMCTCFTSTWHYLLG